MQAYNRKAAAYQQVQTKQHFISLKKKKATESEYILKSEVKLKGLKNLREKQTNKKTKQLCTYIYRQIE